VLWVVLFVGEECSRGGGGQRWHFVCGGFFFIHVGWCLYCKIKRSDEETKAKGLSCCEA
jgi:hypothetical protein